MKVGNQKFTRSVRGRVGIHGGEGSSEDGESEVHWNCRREESKYMVPRVLVKMESRKFTGNVGGKVTECYSGGSSEGGEPEVH